MTINMIVVLTKAAGGDEASALINSTLANLIGVFITPALLFMYMD
jgi:sodium/bile acid cotransporter 7